MYRKSDAPNDGGTPSSPLTTRTPAIILPIVWPKSAWSTVVYAAENTRVNVQSVGASVQASRTCVPQTRCASAPYDVCTRKKIATSSAAASARTQNPAGGVSAMPRMMPQGWGGASAVHESALPKSALRGRPLELAAPEDSPGAPDDHVLAS